jgi:hypothetical protein
MRAFGYGTKEEVWQVLCEPAMAKKLAQSMISSGWLQEYRLANVMVLLVGEAQ